MSSFTKREIIVTFLGLLERQPLSKITVKNIVEACGINRNTFYYYYRNINDLIDDIFNTETEKVTSQNPVHGHWQAGCLQSMHYLVEHSMIIHNVFNSRSHEAIKDYLFKVAHGLLMTFANNTTRGQLIPERDKVFIANFYSHAFVGIFFDWIRSGMKQKPEDLIDMMGRLLNGSIYDVLQRSSQHAMVDKIAS
jgi:AcrR family transcriptional regulator